jgi:hypothetical protein
MTQISSVSAHLPPIGGGARRPWRSETALTAAAVAVNVPSLVLESGEHGDATTSCHPGLTAVGRFPLPPMHPQHQQLSSAHKCLHGLFLVGFVVFLIAGVALTCIGFLDYGGVSSTTYKALGISALLLAFLFLIAACGPCSHLSVTITIMTCKIFSHGVRMCNAGDDGGSQTRLRLSDDVPQLH